MKKIVIMCLVLSMLLGAVGCSKMKKKPTLAETLAIFNDKSLSYDSKLYPYEFSQEDFDNADEGVKKQVSEIYDIILRCSLPTSPETMNKIFLLDFVLRPGLQLDQEEFKKRYSLIEELLIIDDKDDPANGLIALYLYNMINEGDISNDAVNCIVPVLIEHEPDMNDKRFTESREGAFSGMLTQVMYRDLVHFFMWKGDDTAAAEKSDDEEIEKVNQWAEIVKSFPDD